MNSSMLGTGRNWTRRSIEEIGLDIFKRLYKPSGDGNEITATNPLFLSYVEDKESPEWDPYDNIIHSRFGMWEVISTTGGADILYVHTAYATDRTEIPETGLILPSGVAVKFRKDLMPVCWGPYLPGTTIDRNGYFYGEHYGCPEMRNIYPWNGIGPTNWGFYGFNYTVLMNFNVPKIVDGQTTYERKWFNIYFEAPEPEEIEEYPYINYHNLLEVDGSVPDGYSWSYQWGSYTVPESSPRQQLPYMIYQGMDIGYTNLNNWDIIEDLLWDATLEIRRKYNTPTIMSSQDIIFTETSNYNALLKYMLKIDYEPEKILFPEE